MTYHQLLASLKKGPLAPLYLLEGEEPYFIDRLSEWFEQHALPAEQVAFNRFVLYGRDTTAVALIRLARNLPMMGDRQLIVLREAQELGGWNDLLPYLEQPAAHTTLVFCYKSGTFDRRTAVAKVLLKQAVVFTATRLRDSQLPAFIRETAQAENLQMDEKSIALLADHVGNDLSRLGMEISKLGVAMGSRRAVTEDDVARHIGISREYRLFELSKALAGKDRAGAFRIISFLGANPKVFSLYALIGWLYAFFSRVYVIQQHEGRAAGSLLNELGIRPFQLAEYQQAARAFSTEQLQQILAMLLEYDMRLKGIGAARTAEAELLKELTFRILEQR